MGVGVGMGMGMGMGIEKKVYPHQLSKVCGMAADRGIGMEGDCPCSASHA